MFNLDRYRLSLHLPELFQNLHSHTVYHTKLGSFFFFKTVDTAGQDGSSPYVVFFRAFKSHRHDTDVMVEVSSAYLKPGMVRYASPVTFPRLVDSVASGTTLRPGPPQRIKRR